MAEAIRRTPRAQKVRTCSLERGGPGVQTGTSEDHRTDNPGRRKMGQKDRSSTQSAPSPYEGVRDSGAFSRMMIPKASGQYIAMSVNERELIHQVVRRLSALRWHFGPNDLRIHDSYSLCSHHTIEARSGFRSSSCRKERNFGPISALPQIRRI